MKGNGLEVFMKACGSITSNTGVHWLKIPGQRSGGYSSIVGLSAMSQRPLRIMSTATRKSGVAPKISGPNASAGSAR